MQVVISIACNTVAVNSYMCWSLDKDSYKLSSAAVIHCICGNVGLFRLCSKEQTIRFLEISFGTSKGRLSRPAYPDFWDGLDNVLSVSYRDLSALL